MSNTAFKGFPKYRLDDAREELAKSHARIVRAAAKTGQSTPAAPELNVIAERIESRCGHCRATMDGFAVDGQRCSNCRHTVLWTSVVVVDLELIAERPMLAGWDFLAVVEPLEGGNLIRQIPGANVVDGELNAWRTGAISCDHCATTRRRTETFIVRADGSDPAIALGTHRQVGRNCLADFLGGKSAASIVSALGWPKLIQGMCDEEGNGGGSRAPQIFNPAVVMAWVAAIVRSCGFVSKGAARDRESVTATADEVLFLLGEFPSNSDLRAEWSAGREKHQPAAEDIATGAAALKWAFELNPTSDYEQNLALVARQPALEAKHIGILASAIAAHARVLGQAVARAAAGLLPSSYQGKVGDKVEIEITVERCSTFETQFGNKHINTMRDAAGNCYVWKTSSVAMKAGEQRFVTGTVKAHTEYKGLKQTELTRCTVFTAEERAKRAEKAPKAKRARKSKAPAAPDWMPERIPVDGSAPACTLHTGLTLRETVETPGAIANLARELESVAG